MAEATALGSHFARSTDGGVTYNNVGQVTNIKPPKIASTDVKYDILDGDGYTRYLPGQTDPGTVSLTVLFDAAEADHAAMFADSLAPQPNRYYKIILPDGKAYAFQAYIKDFQQAELKVDAMQEATITFQISNGGPTLG